MNEQDIVVKVENIGKLYRIPKANNDHKYSLVEYGKRYVRRIRSAINFRFDNALGNDTDFWALRNVSFAVKRGEAVGIIGPNGAGKSTLLRILARITEPTEGSALIRGRLGSLLQVGAGFHNELTGRENIFLNGAILGMRVDQIKSRFDEIVSFSGIGKFIDTPIKFYSSGMRVRLGFSVAVNLDPEILLLDEVFAVGDAEFRQRCLDRLSSELLQGRTILFVSHNMEQVQRLVQRCIVLEHGRVAYIGDAAKGIERYNTLSSFQKKALLFPTQNDLGAQIDKCYLVGLNGDPTDSFPCTRDMRVRVEFTIRQSEPDDSISVVVSFSTENGQFITTSSTDDVPGVPEFRKPGRYYFDSIIPGNIFLPSRVVIRPAANVNNKAVHNHPRYGQGLTVSLFDPETDQTDKMVVGRNSALLAMKPMAEYGIIE